MSEELQPQPELEAPDNLPSILIGAGSVLIIDVIPYLSLINFACCVGVLFSGAITVWHYTDRYKLTLSNGEGFKLGFIAGIIGSFAALIISFATQLAFDYTLGQESAELFTKWIAKTTSGNDPSVAIKMEEEMLKAKAEGLTITKVVQGVLGSAIGALVVGLGGVIGAAIFKKAPVTE